MTALTVRPAPAARSRRRQRAAPGARPSLVLTVAALATLGYFLLPLLWLVIASTKSIEDLFNTFGLWFSDDPALAENIAATLARDDGVFVTWMSNTVLYSGTAAVGAALLSALAGYGFAKFDFPGKDLLFIAVLATIMVPTTALAIPTYLLFSDAGLVNTPWAIVLPSLVSPFGVFLMRAYAQEAVPDSLLEAARVDGAREARIFFRIVLPLLVPGLVTVLLFTLVATWNNYFLPLIMLSDPDLYPVTVGLAQWQSVAAAGGGGSAGLLPLVITGSLLSILPLIAAFLVLQRYWRSGLDAGAVKG
jgi:multiple sugar transport system permease protein